MHILKIDWDDAGYGSLLDDLAQAALAENVFLRA